MQSCQNVRLGRFVGSLSLVMLTLVCSAASAEDPGVLRKPLLGKIPPELVVGENDWLAGPAISLKQLQGRVVWLQFNF